MLYVLKAEKCQVNISADMKIIEDLSAFVYTVSQPIASQKCQARFEVM